MKLYVIINTVIYLMALSRCEQNHGDVYVEKHPGHHLNGHVIRTMTTSNIFSCIVECRRTSKCWSLNVDIGSTAFVQCKLNSAIRTSDMQNFVSRGTERQYLELLDGWHRYKSFGYKYIQDKIDVPTARQRCHQLSAGADLVSFGDREEQEFVISLLKGMKLVDTWIGLNDEKQEGKFVWFDGSNSTYRTWKDDKLPKENDSKNCVEMKEGFDWRDDKCAGKRPFICKKFYD